MKVTSQRLGELIGRVKPLATKNKIVLFILILLCVLIVVMLPRVFLGNNFSNPFERTKELPRIWRIVFSFDFKTRQLKVKSVNVAKGNAKQSVLQFSRYRLYVRDNNNKILYSDAITITEFIDFQYIPDKKAEVGSTPDLKPFDTTVAIPYFPTADHIEVTKDNIEVLRFKPVKSTSTMNFIPSADAASTQTCEKIHVVFLQDSYQDINLYHQHADQIKNDLLSASPYKDYPNLFDFRVINNTQGFGCSVNDRFNWKCVLTPQVMLTRALQEDPTLPQNNDFLKVIVLVDANTSLDGRAGITLGLGSQFGAFETRSELRNVAVHEIGGHAIGYLYDRYVFASSNDPIETPANSATGVKSNCTDNANGEVFWSSARISSPNAFPSCIFPNFYAPSPLNCPGSTNGSLVSFGNSGSVMSAAGTCAQNAGFDSVEDYWIRNVVIQKYLACPNITPTISGGTISGRTFRDANSNGGLDAGETGVQGVEVILTGPSGDVGVVSDSAGNFTINNVAPGSYSLKSVRYNNQPVNITMNPFTLASHGTASMSPLPIPESFFVTPTPTAPVINSLKGGAYLDNNGNQIQDAGEPGLGGVTIVFDAPLGTLSTITNTSGTFTLTNLPLGSYKVNHLVYSGTILPYTSTPIIMGANTIATIPYYPIPRTAIATPTVRPTTTLTPSPRITPTSTPTSSSNTENTTKGEPIPTEEPIVFYDCHEVSDTQQVNGKPINITRLQCDPIQQ